MLPTTLVTTCNALAHMHPSLFYAACVKDSKGLPSNTRDCLQFHRVGDVLMSIPISFPIVQEFLPVFSYYTRDAKSSGLWDSMIEDFTSSSIQYACAVSSRRRSGPASVRMDAASPYDQSSRRRGSSGAAAGAVGSQNLSPSQSSSASLPWTSMIGTLFVAVAVQLVAVLLWLFESWYGKTFTQILHLHNSPFAEPEGEHVQEQVGNDNTKKGSAASSSQSQDSNEMLAGEANAVNAPVLAHEHSILVHCDLVHSANGWHPSSENQVFLDIVL